MKSSLKAQNPTSLRLAALAVTAVWGFNFVVIKCGTNAVPPLLLAAFRFALVLPALAVVERPRARCAAVAAYGLILGVGEFGLLFTAIKLGAPSGASSLILQAQAPFTALLAVPFLGQKLRASSLLGMVLAGTGLGVIGWRSHESAAWGGHFLLALGMLLGAAFMWAIANLLAQRMGKVGGLNLMVWSSIASPLPLLGLSLVFEGPHAIVAALRALSCLTVAALVYLVLLSTLFGYGVWNHLIVEHGAERVAPFSMLVPLFGIAAGWLVLGETLSLGQLAGVALVLSGLVVHQCGLNLG